MSNHTASTEVCHKKLAPEDPPPLIQHGKFIFQSASVFVGIDEHDNLISLLHSPSRSYHSSGTNEIIDCPFGIDWLHYIWCLHLDCNRGFLLAH